MTHSHEYACQEAQQLMQEMLDQRWAQPLPDSLLQHLQRCESCAAWKSLFHYEPETTADLVPSQFATHVVHSFQRRTRRRNWLMGSAVAALAACLLFAVFLETRSLFIQPVSTASPRIAMEIPDVLSLVKNEVEQFPGYVRHFRSASFDLIPDLPEIDWKSDDPIAVSLPPLKSLGQTLQGAMEPIEQPAKAAYKKVKEMMDDPELRKWMQSVRRGAV